VPHIRAGSRTRDRKGAPRRKTGCQRHERHPRQGSENRRISSSQRLSLALPDPLQHLMSRAELAPAKINLALHVTGRRDDGYHLIESLAVFTRFGDRLNLELADSDSFEVTGPYSATLPADEINL